MNNQKSKEPKRGRGRGRPPGKSNKETKYYDEWKTNKKQNEFDACDCLTTGCPGCWYPCESCGSNKCSTFCRTLERNEPLEWKISD